MSDTAGSPPAAGYCRQCGKPLTPETLREVQGAYYCADCLGSWVQQGPTRRQKSAEGRAATAAALGIIPGLGAVYNGEYIKALIHVLIFATLIWAANNVSDLFGLAIAAFVIYMPIEAYQTAKAKAMSARSGSATGASDSLQRRRETIGPLLLIAIGTLALLNELNIIDFDRIISFWPLGLIALGVWLLMKRQEG